MDSCRSYDPDRSCGMADEVMRDEGAGMSRVLKEGANLFSAAFEGIIWGRRRIADGIAVFNKKDI